MAHNVTSDSHDAGNRPPSIANEVREAGFGELLGWLTEEVPGAILEGGPVPRARTWRRERPSLARGARAQASLTIAMIMPIRTNTMIATCIHIQCRGIRGAA